MPSNVALLGTGLFAKMAYLPALKSSSDAVFKAVWSRSASSVDKFISEAGVENLQGFSGAEGFEKILADGDIQSVMIALPITSQPDLIIKCLEAGKHVMSEKPVAKDKATALGLIERYEKEFKPKGLIWRVAESEFD
jgi:predicted dehydrogenase